MPVGDGGVWAEHAERVRLHGVAVRLRDGTWYITAPIAGGVRLIARYAIDTDLPGAALCHAALRLYASDEGLPVTAETLAEGRVATRRWVRYAAHFAFAPSCWHLYAIGDSHAACGAPAPEADDLEDADFSVDYPKGWKCEKCHIVWQQGARQ